MNNFKAQLLKNGKVTKTFEQKTSLDWDTWRFKIALNELKPQGQEIRWFINNERVLS